MHKPAIPFEFDPGSAEYETEHLVYADVPGGKKVSWPLANASIFVPQYDYHPDLEAIEAANIGYFAMHGRRGFTAGAYTELLVNELPGFMAFKMNNFEVSFGRASPLAAFIFSDVHREKYFGAWELIDTARIIGPSQGLAELAFLNACIHYKEKLGVLPQTAAMDESFLWWEKPDRTEPVSHTIGPPIKDLEPLRFYYRGLEQHDDSAACIYFFRALEFYSFLTNQAKLSKLRGDVTVSEADFAKRVLELITKEEKGPLLQLINQVAGKDVVDQAFDLKLMPNKSSGSLGEAIYTFRNSIVHGKVSYGYTLLSSSVIDDDKALPQWRALLRALARRAIELFGSQLI